MDKFMKQLEDFEKSVNKLIEAVELAEEKKDTELYPFFRDSSIQRFEFTFEIFRKLVKTAMKEFEGILCNSPKSCMRELFKRLKAHAELIKFVVGRLRKHEQG